MILGDLGAEVIKIEPVRGDGTRRLLGAGAGFFRTFNRNKQCIAVNVETPEGREAVLQLIDTADVFIENFKPGRMHTLGLDYPALRQRNPRLIYASHKGFLSGPYDNRLALDEVVQMMAGLAYMTGPVGRPLRAGSSVNDIMGGMFGAIGVLAASTSATPPAAAERCKVPSTRTACCWQPSTCSSTWSPARQQRRCPIASVHGPFMTCSPSPVASRCSLPPR